MLKYYVYDVKTLIAGFTALVQAVYFVEEWRSECATPVYIIDAITGETVATWCYGKWDSTNEFFS